ncbi:MAG TPA: DUF3501 family protein [Polyangiales bacterium]|jgi:hypothetical protein|nr:DUF3501 family protein [Polyangiales bacterium]
MKPVTRDELLGLSAYEQIRPHFRGRVIVAKTNRRVLVGPHMSMVFENHDTVLLQVQEMLRTERITDEKAIEHELSTYNELIGAPGSLCATLFIEYDNPEERSRMLQRFATLRTAVQLKLGDKAYVATFGTHHGEEMDRLPAVNYLTFTLGPEAAAQLRDPSVPAAIEITHPDYPERVELAPPMRTELAADLVS